MTRRLPCHRAFCCILAFAVAFFAVPEAFAARPGVRPAKQAFNAPQPFSPGAWHVNITGNDASPPQFVAVDKQAQTLFLFERHSPLRLANTFVCSTGQKIGDKLVEGDLKTPEGVYFVERKLSGGLDFEKFGYEAYTLNYPNPVDRLRRKTGHGIWIHGRGVPITPNVTEGCVSLNNADIAVLRKNLTPGTPVALAEGVSFSPVTPPDVASTITELHRKTHGWATAWAGKSKKFFEYYDAESYAIAQGERFEDFRAQKERVFGFVKWIEIGIRNVQALQGPGYWVTWFEQDYRASNISSKGVRRLYWQKDKKGEMRIVGMEWEPSLSGTLTAGLNGAPGASVTAATLGTSATADGALALSAKPAPVMEAVPAAAKPVAVAAVKPEAAGEQTAAAAKPAPEKPVAGEVSAAAATPEKKAPASQNALPAGGASAETAPATEAAPAATKPVAVAAVKPEAAPIAEAVPAPSASPAEPPVQKAALPVKEQPAAGQTPAEPAAPVREAPVAVATAKPVPPVRDKAGPQIGDVPAFLEKWRAAWEKGDLNAYAACYTADAVQGGREGREAIRSHKRGLWDKSRPAEVLLTNIRIINKQNNIVVDMHQSYTDSRSFADMGVKTLYLKAEGGIWRIAREDWSPMQQ